MSNTVSLGRIVHYHDSGKDYPAVISDFKIDETEGTVECHLTVFRPRGIFWPWSIEGTKVGQWSWPVTLDSILDAEVIKDA